MGIIETQSAGKVSELFDSIAALVPGLAAEAATFDRAAEFPRESMAKLQHAGLLMAPVPLEFGGVACTRPATQRPYFDYSIDWVTRTCRWEEFSKRTSTRLN
jgi:alkylation response protein AidB-like acyl-CoA dehydrogenase